MSRSEDYLDFNSILIDFLKNTDKKNWNTRNLFQYAKENKNLNFDELNDLRDWVIVHNAL